MLCGFEHRAAGYSLVDGGFDRFLATGPRWPHVATGAVDRFHTLSARWRLGPGKVAGFSGLGSRPWDCDYFPDLGDNSLRESSVASNVFALGEASRPKFLYAISRSSANAGFLESGPASAPLCTQRADSPDRRNHSLC